MTVNSLEIAKKRFDLNRKILGTTGCILNLFTAPERRRIVL